MATQARRRLAALALLLVLVGSSIRPVVAGPAADQIALLEDRVAALEARIAALEARPWPTSAPTATATPTASSTSSPSAPGTPSPSPAPPSPVPSASAAPSTSPPSSSPPPATPSASPTPTATGAPTATPAPSTVPTPTPTAAPGASSAPTLPPTDGFIGPPVANLPTSGSAWTALRAAADASPGTPDIACNQDQRSHPGTALASALVYARTSDPAYRTKAIALIEAAVPTARDCGNAILSLGRQLGAYVLAADYVGYRDPAFVAWLSDIRTRSFLASHSRWFTLTGTATDSSNNWGTFALASLTVADAYLRDDAGLARDWAVFAGYGDGSWPFRLTASYQAIWSCPAGYALNPASCTDPRLEGAAVEDASRTTFPTIGGYPAEAAQGYVLVAEVLSRAGFPAWAVNDRQVCRNALWRERLGNLNKSSADTHVTWVTNARCGLAQPTQPAVFGRVWGFTDWLYGGG